MNCIPCQEAGVKTAATRVVQVLVSGRRRAMPMCTAHAGQHWHPLSAIVSPITIRPKPVIAERLCACGCKQTLPVNYGKLRFILGHAKGRRQLGQEIR